MRRILEKISASAPAKVAVTLEHADRQKSRGLLRLDDGSEAALILERGSGLRHGDRLLADDGVVVMVQAAREGLSVVTADDPLDLMRAAYHLGNRHIPVQIERAAPGLSARPRARRHGARARLSGQLRGRALRAGVGSLWRTGTRGHGHSHAHVTARRREAAAACTRTSTRTARSRRQPRRAHELRGRPQHPAAPLRSSSSAQSRSCDYSSSRARRFRSARSRIRKGSSKRSSSAGSTTKPALRLGSTEF